MIQEIECAIIFFIFKYTYLFYIQATFFPSPSTCSTSPNPSSVFPTTPLQIYSSIYVQERAESHGY